MSIAFAAATFSGHPVRQMNPMHVLVCAGGGDRRLSRLHQVDSTAQFLDWFKRPFPNQGYYEWARQRAQALEEQRKPLPTKTVWAIGSMEWLAEQENAR
jgi:hypothetical protein